MIDEDEQVPAKAPFETSALLYDYLKHIASLSLITLGGILTIAQMDDTNDIKPFNLIAAIVLVGVGGGAAFACATELTTNRYSGDPLSRAFEFTRKLAPISFLLGVGYALAMFVNVMV